MVLFLLALTSRGHRSSMFSRASLSDIRGTCLNCVFVQQTASYPTAVPVHILKSAGPVVVDAHCQTSLGSTLRAQACGRSVPIAEQLMCLARAKFIYIARDAPFGTSCWPRHSTGAWQLFCRISRPGYSKDAGQDPHRGRYDAPGPVRLDPM